MAEWLNSTFAGLDGGMFSAMNSLAKSAGTVMTPIFKVISLLGEKGILLILASIVLMCFPNTRRAGVCLLGAIACGALITNLILKNSVMRLRPFEESEVFKGYWEFIGKPAEDDYSFPSGHTTAFCAFATAMFLSFNKKWSYVGFFGVVLMGLSRIYLIAHYTTDVLAGIVVGGISGVAAYFIAKGIFDLLKKHSDNRFCKFCLNADIVNLFCKAEPLQKNQPQESSTEEKKADAAKDE